MDENMDYTQLVHLLEKSDPADIYEQLIKKEDRVLDTINRTINYSNEKQLDASEVFNMSLHEIIRRFFWTLRTIFHDLFRVKTGQDLWQVMLKDDRKIYLGTLLLCVCIILFFISITT